MTPYWGGYQFNMPKPNTQFVLIFIVFIILIFFYFLLSSVVCLLLCNINIIPLVYLYGLRKKLYHSKMHRHAFRCCSSHVWYHFQAWTLHVLQGGSGISKFGGQHSSTYLATVWVFLSSMCTPLGWSTGWHVDENCYFFVLNKVSYHLSFLIKDTLHTAHNWGPCLFSFTDFFLAHLFLKKGDFCTFWFTWDYLQYLNTYIQYFCEVCEIYEFFSHPYALNCTYTHFNGRFQMFWMFFTDF